MTIPRQDENKMMHISLPVGTDDMIMASDVLESRGQKLVVGNNVAIMISPDSKDEADRVFKALSAGGKVEMAIANQPWGDYYGGLIDKFGFAGWSTMPTRNPSDDPIGQAVGRGEPVVAFVSLRTG